jgi:hypothetical protein
MLLLLLLLRRHNIRNMFFEVPLSVSLLFVVLSCSVSPSPFLHKIPMCPCVCALCILIGSVFSIEQDYFLIFHFSFSTFSRRKERKR